MTQLGWPLLVVGITFPNDIISEYLQRQLYSSLTFLEHYMTLQDHFCSSVWYQQIISIFQAHNGFLGYLQSCMSQHSKHMTLYSIFFLFRPSFILQPATYCCFKEQSGHSEAACCTWSRHWKERQGKATEKFKIKKDLSYLKFMSIILYLLDTREQPFGSCQWGVRKTALPAHPVGPGC